MARPLKEVDAEQVQKLAELGCKVKEIADFFNVTEELIIRRFKDELTKGRANVQISLRRWQLQAAQKGNVSMLIWLGKQMLGQQDKSKEEIDAMMVHGQTAITKDELIRFLRESKKHKKENESQTGDSQTSKQADNGAEGSQV